ncbi:MAG: universal stress protein [Chloroflexi bacterium]|nr:MAG: universal stress protein [Chloroflexota bacterium]
MTQPVGAAIHRILVPLDGSQLAEEILPYAIEIARRAGAEVLLLTAIQPVGIWNATASAINWEQEEKSAQDYLDAVAQRLTADGLRVRTQREHGDAGGAVLRAAEEADARMVAMTTHGRSGIGRWLFGSVADRIIQSANVPLLVIRVAEDREPRPVDFQKILVPLDGSEVASSIVPLIEDFARLFGASLVLYHAVCL